MLQVILTVRDEEKWYQSVRDVIVRLYRYMLRPFFWHTRLGRQYTAIIGWGLQYMFHGERPLAPLLYCWAAVDMQSVLTQPYGDQVMKAWSSVSPAFLTCRHV